MKIRTWTSLAALLVVAACTRSVGSLTPPVPTSSAETEAPQTLITLTPPPSETPLPTSEVPAPTEEQPAQAAPTDAAPYPPPPTETSGPPAEPSATPPASETPVSTPTITPTPFDAAANLGSPTFTDPMNASSFGNWSRDAQLPDTASIRLELEDGKLRVTGKQQFFDTWWFSWPTVSDFYLEMTVETETCSGQDTYGVIFRGPPRDFGDTFGYMALFTCDGQYQLRRVVSADPYTVFELTPWTRSASIKSGSNQTNVLGIRARGDTFTLFANGFQIARIKDDNYKQGRYGVFVSAGPTFEFSYLVDEIRYWDLR